MSVKTLATGLGKTATRTLRALLSEKRPFPCKSCSLPSDGFLLPSLRCRQKNAGMVARLPPLAAGAPPMLRAGLGGGTPGETGTFDTTRRFVLICEGIVYKKWTAAPECLA